MASAPPPHAHLFHLVQRPLWSAAVDAAAPADAPPPPPPGVCYYPPTYAQDGFTHLTADPDLLLAVANQFYRSVPADVEWRLLVLDAAALAAAPGAGRVRYEAAAPVGAVAAREDDAGRLYPHLYGGIPASGGVVVAELPMRRAPGEGGAFLAIDGIEAWGGGGGGEGGGGR
jgi:uncharacterized protein (DUF952 family)